MTSVSHAGSTSPQPIKQVALPNGMPLTQYKLDNGLNIYVIENHAAPVFTYQTWFNAGSKTEKLDPKLQATGLAHLFEHMMFRGTAKHGDGQFDDILTRAGVHDENATTWFDRTNYYESLPKDKLATVMDLESDRMINLVVDQKLLETEKGAVLGEYNLGLDDPDTISYDKLYEAAFTVHPYRYTTIGTANEIKSFTVDQANYFYKRYYSPSNATVLVIGDVDPAKVAAAAQQYYGGVPGQTVLLPTAPVEPTQSLERKVQFQHPQLKQTRVLIGHHIPGVKDADFPALWVLMSTLTYGQGALLELNWVNAGVTVWVRGDINQFADPGLFIVAADLQPGKTPDDAEKAFDDTISALLSGGADGLIARAKNQLLLSLNSQLEDNESMASFLGEYIPTAGDPTFGFSLITAIQNLTPADLLRVAGKYLQPSNRTLVVGTPQ